MTASKVHRTIEAVFRIESAKLIAGLMRMVRDVGLAEELAQDALVAALERWPESGIRYLKAKDYREVACRTLREMHRQVGPLQIGDDGLARRGVLVRHLVMPGLLDESRAIFDFLASEVSPDTYVNIMGQYRPEYRASEYPEINRRPTLDEFATARRLGRQSGLHRFDERSPRRLFVIGR